MIIKRYLEEPIKKWIGKNKVILILGARRVGKTYLINHLLEQYEGKKRILNGEDFDVQNALKNRSKANYERIIGDATLLIIDEAQAVPEIGSVLKLMIDSIPQLTIIATGSSSLNLTNTTGEPLTGRQYPINLYPIAQLELSADPIQATADLEARLIYGSYPEIFQLKEDQEKEIYLKELTNSYLFKDILAFSGIKHADKLVDLLKLISFQIGSEVSYHELSIKLGINKVTVETYLDLLQKVFVLFRVPSYSTNPRKEISKGSKWYFYDLGIRNMIIQDFRPLSFRNDKGMLWENYVISERKKRNDYKKDDRQMYFWRNYNQQEIDLIEIKNGKIDAFEIKYGNKQTLKLPSGFSTTYPNATVQLINQDNFLDFIL